MEYLLSISNIRLKDSENLKNIIKGALLVKYKELFFSYSMGEFFCTSKKVLLSSQIEIPFSLAALKGCNGFYESVIRSL